MAKNNRTCIICGHQYRYCGTCVDYAHLPTWMNIYHNENCKKIADIQRSYAMGDYDEGAAKAMLMQCDLSAIDKLKGSFKATYEKLFPVEVSEDKDESNTAVTEEVEASVEDIEHTEEKMEDRVVEISPNIKEVNFKKYGKKRG